MRIASFVSAASLVLTGAVALAQNVTFDFDRSAIFSRFKSYAWVSGAAIVDGINHDRIVNAVSAQLGTKGLTRVDRDGHPDLLAAYHTTFDRDLQITGFATGWGPYRFGPSRTAVARTEEILTGTLVVDLVDARTNAIVWRGSASKEIDVRADAGKRDRTINRAAERLFKHYPPVN